MDLYIALNVYSVTINLIALVLCLFHYVEHLRRDWVYALLFLLSNLMSNYYWGSYLLLMNADPEVSSTLAYFGWNLGAIFLVLLAYQSQSKEERRFLHPLVFLPIPLNIYQLTLYLPFGGVLNSVYQTTVFTILACQCCQSIVWYAKHRKDGAPFPYVAASLLFYTSMEFGMWTSSCFDWSSQLTNPYTYCALLSMTFYLMLIWAIGKANQGVDSFSLDYIDQRLRKSLQLAFVGFLLACCGGGLLLGAWMREKLTVEAQFTEGSEAYQVIAIVLFILSLVLVVFTLSIMLVASFARNIAESNRLKEEKRIAEHSNAAKSDFLANMSHEIRTPINAVLGMNEMVMRESLRARDQLANEDEAARGSFNRICSYSGDIESAGNNLLSIINDILDFSKIEAGKMELVQSDYKLSSVLNDVSNMVLFRARGKGLEFRVEVDEALPDGLHGDEVRVRQVMTNILNNAVKYSERGTILMTVNSQKTGEDSIDLVVSVKDEGIGIREEDLAKLFAKFERMDLGHNSTVEGTGLGLAITKSLLDLMGGTISVESEYGKGSTFTVVMPQKVMSYESVGNFREKFEKSVLTAKARQEGFHAPDARILVVDDTRMNITVVKGLLASTQIKIDAVLSGRESLEMAKATRYDLILMDQRMPGMDGTEALRLIRAQEDGANVDTPIICLTADAVSGAKERYLSQGFDDYVTKPVNGVMLEKKLLAYLPNEKIIPNEVAEVQKPSVPATTDYGALELLRPVGIDPAMGLGHCQQDENLYYALLEEYQQSAHGKACDLERFASEGDWNNYAVVVHSVKSSSRTIGAVALADQAAVLEEASSKGLGEEVMAGHGAMMRAWQATASAIGELLGLEEPEPSSQEGEVLEFAPEGEEVLEFAPEGEDEVLEFLPDER